MGTPESFEMFGLKEIAGWWITEYWKPNKKIAALPALQRGFVWKAEQVERLWDSIAQEFPIGSLLLSEFDESKGVKSAQGCDQPDKPTYHLLDGQQRATSIVKGFQDIWTPPEGDHVSALWVDLNPEGMDKTDRRFLFRLVTKSHPWGYQKNDPSGRLRASQASNALGAFRLLDREHLKNPKKPHEFGIHEVFPWDASAPVPLALLLKAIDSKGDDTKKVSAELLNLLDKTLIWERFKKMPADNKSKASLESLERVNDLLTGEKTDGWRSFSQLVRQLHEALEKSCMPAPVMTGANRDLGVVNNTPDDCDDYSTTFNLFKRINSGGTALSNEEIQYSLLKTVWPQAPEVIEKIILSERQLTRPARMVSLMARLFLMVNNKTPEWKPSKVEGLQEVLNITQFQRMLHASKASEKPFEEFCKTQGNEIVTQVWNFLAYKKNGHEFGLPKMLAARISENHQDLLLLLMYWMSKVRYRELSSKRRSLGFVTALAWFAQDEGKCIRRLAQILREQKDESLVDFFNYRQFDLICEKDEQDRVMMFQLPSPEKVEESLKRPLWQGDKIADSSLDVWKKKSFWELYPVGENEYLTTDEERFLLHKIFDDPGWNKLLYAQRKCIEEWYDWFDPTQPDAIRERNCPWDYDHILPKNWVNYKGLPEQVRIWLWSIGNFRAWPMEHNRSKSDDLMIEAELLDYDLKNKMEVLSASFIRERKSGRKKWEDLTQMVGEGSPKFWNENNADAWKVFIEAALLRTVDIYREWYETLDVESIVTSDTDKG